jgi:hypothetical protein
MLELLQPLANVMACCECGLLQTIRNNFAHSDIQFLKEKINELINENTTYSKGIQQMITQQCFAIKPGINGLLGKWKLFLIKEKQNTIYSELSQFQHFVCLII